MHSAPPLYAITDPALLPGEHLFSGVAAAIAGGCSWIQYRDKTATAAERLQRAARLNALCQALGASLIINDDVALAQAVGAAGVHLGREDGSLAKARQMLGPHAIIGATCHDSLAFAQQALAAGASYLAFGRFFPSATKPQAGAAPLSLIAQAQALAAPVVVIGGINPQNLPVLKAAGARSFALCEAVFGGAAMLGGEPIEARCRQLLALAQA